MAFAVLFSQCVIRSHFQDYVCEPFNSVKCESISADLWWMVLIVVGFLVKDFCFLQDNGLAKCTGSLF